MDTPLIYYSFYDRSSPASGPAFEHELGRRLLIRGLEAACGIRLTMGELEGMLKKTAAGKPVLPEGFPCFNITHCPGLAACVISSCPAGIDAEYVRPFRDSLLRKVLTPEERLAFDSFLKKEPGQRSQHFLRYWTLKESYIKYTGEGLARPLTDISFLFRPEDLHPAPGLPGKGYIRPASSIKELSFFQRFVSRDHILSLCTSSSAAPLDTEISFSTDNRS